MYIKREPLGRGRLAFKKRRARYPLVLIALYLGILAAALYVYLRMDTIQPRVLAALGPAPTPTLSVGELTALAQQAYLDGKLELAAEYYRQAAEVEPQNVQVLTDLARVLTLEEQLDEALAVAEHIILIAPEDPRGYAAKARVLDWQGNYDQAVTEALRAIELDPNYAPAHAYLGEAFADLGRLRQAREQVELAVQLDPYNVDVRRNYGYVLEFYGDYLGAVQQYQQALRLHPNLLDLWYGLARNYRGSGQTDLAIQTFQQIIIRTPDDPYPYVELGKTYFEIRDDAAAQEALEQAVSLVCPDCPLYTYDEGRRTPLEERQLPEQIYMPAWTRLGMVYFTRRNYEDAIAIFEEAIAWGEANDQTVPLEAYYVTAAGYYYLDLCAEAVPRSLEALDIYQRRRLEDPAALNNILSVFVLCRDYARDPYVYTGAGFTNGFPDGYQEPDVLIERPGSGSQGQGGTNP
jgi:tetratricopeptide (TPR) repeat protein